ncbi:MAG: hypothetical protein LBV80_10640 [Deltaproteobacteria bacterium]|nr:hypothetical protein [Deltaproteobacteria bacterium]
MAQYRVYCLASGLLEIGNNVPDRALPLVTHNDKQELIDALNTFAMRLFDGSEAWFVPKVALFYEISSVNGSIKTIVSGDNATLKFRDDLQEYLFERYAPRHRDGLTINWDNLDPVKYKNAIKNKKNMQWRKSEAMKILKCAI